MRNKATFYPRTPAPRNNPDYISVVNEQLYLDPTSVNPNDEIYKRAIDQYNSSISKASTIRPEIPEGFCGYIDPDSGFLRVEPLPTDPFFMANTPVVVSTDDVSVTTTSTEEWPSDECLKPNDDGIESLPGAPLYSQIIDENGRVKPKVCTSEPTSPIEATGIKWGSSASLGCNDWGVIWGYDVVSWDDTKSISSRVSVNLPYDKDWVAKLDMTGLRVGLLHDKFIDADPSGWSKLQFFRHRDGKLAVRVANNSIDLSRSSVGSTTTFSPPDHWGIATTADVNGNHIMELHYSYTINRFRILWDGIVVGDWCLNIRKTPGPVTNLEFKSAVRGTISYKVWDVR